MPTLYGPTPGEGQALRYGPLDRVALISDVHANVPALRAVLADIALDDIDLVVCCGDLTWGPEPEPTVQLVRSLGDRAVFVRGNCDRVVVELAAGLRAAEFPREEWLPGQHSAASVDFLRGFAFSVVLDVRGLGAVRVCHGSPRSDTEVVTTGTPADRFAALMGGVAEPMLVTGHTHLQFDRVVDGRWRSVNAGSVGLPNHEGAPGTAYWAVLGPDVQLRQSSYDVEAALAALSSTGDPSAERVTELLTSPPTPAGVTAHGESVVFSG